MLPRMIARKKLAIHVALVLAAVLCMQSCNQDDKSPTGAQLFEIDAKVLRIAEIRFSEATAVGEPRATRLQHHIEFLMAVVEEADKRALGVPADNVPSLGSIWTLILVDEEGSLLEVRTHPGGVWYYFDHGLSDYVEMRNERFIEFSNMLRGTEQ